MTSLFSRRSITTACLAAVLITLLSCLPRPAVADATARVSGVVTGVDSGTLPAALTLESSLGTVTLSLDASTQFTVDQGNPEDPSNDGAQFVANPRLLLGRFVDASYDSTTNEASLVDVESVFQNAGPITAVSGRAAPASVTVDMSFGGALTVKVTPDTEVTIDGEPVESLLNLRGLMTRVEYDPDTLIASKVDAATLFHRLRGTVVSANPDADQLIVNTGTRHIGIRVSEFAFVTLDFQRATLADLKRGQEVVVQFAQDDGGPEAAEVQALTPATTTVSGTVGTVSTTSQTLDLGGSTVRAANVAAAVATRKPTLLKVNPGTRILLNGRRITLSRIPRGARVTARVALRNGTAMIRTLTVTSSFFGRP
jgi:hypothetical protein